MFVFSSRGGGEGEGMGYLGRNKGGFSELFVTAFAVHVLVQYTEEPAPCFKNAS